MTATIRSLVIGARGYVGSTLVELLRGEGFDVTGASRRGGCDIRITNGADLDRELSVQRFDQIVLTPQLTDSGVGWLLDRIDGARWIVLSSAQVVSKFPAPGTATAVAHEQKALALGATVLRPTMIFGRGGDGSITRLIRNLKRRRVVFQLGAGRQLVQPLHVADLAGLVGRHATSPVAGLFWVGGDEAVPVRDLNRRLLAAVGIHAVVVRVPVSVLRAAARIGVAGLRADQIRRLAEDKSVENGETCRAFAWRPEGLDVRLRQAAAEILM